MPSTPDNTPPPEICVQGAVPEVVVDKDVTTKPIASGDRFPSAEEIRARERLELASIVHK